MTVVKCNPRSRRGRTHYSGNLFNSIANELLNLDNFFDAKVPVRSNTGVNIAETDSAFEIEIAIPGISKEEFELKVEKDTLKIKAEKKNVKSEEAGEDAKTEARKYYRREFNATTFNRSFHLPENVDVDNIAARHENGILLVTLPKTLVEEQEAKTITIA